MAEDRNTIQAPEPPDELAQLNDELRNVDSEETRLLKERERLDNELSRLKMVKKQITNIRKEILTGRESNESAIDNLAEACEEEVQRRIDTKKQIYGEEDDRGPVLAKDIIDKLQKCRDENENNDLVSAILFIYGISVPNIDINTIPELDINNKEDRAVLAELDPFINKEMENAIALVDKKSPLLMKKRIQEIKNILEPFEQMRNKYEAAA